MKYLALLLSCISVSAMAQVNADRDEFFQILQRTSFSFNYESQGAYRPVRGGGRYLDAFIEVSAGKRKCYFGVASGHGRDPGILTLDTDYLCLTTKKSGGSSADDDGATSGAGNLNPGEDGLPYVTVHSGPVSDFPEKVTIEY